LVSDGVTIFLYLTNRSSRMNSKDIWIYSLTGILAIVIITGFFTYSRVSKDINSLRSDLAAAKQDYGLQITGLRDEALSGDDLLRSEIADISEEVGIVKNASAEQKKQLEESKKEVSALGERIEGIKDVGTDFATIVKNVINTVVTIKTNVGQGSGVLVTEDGYMITNYHVLAGATTAAAFTYEGDKFQVRLVSYDSGKDIAVLQARGSGFEFIAFGDSDDVDVGDRVIAVGSPGGFTSTVTEGIVSAVDRKGDSGMRYIQTDVSISPGNSGGPLISTDAAIIGINTWKIAATGFEGIGFALRSNDVRDYAENVIRMDKNDTSWEFD